MINAFLVPGFHPTRSFMSTDFDLLREHMEEQSIELHGVSSTWGNYGIAEYGHLACSQIEKKSNIDVVIGHSLGAIALLSVVKELRTSHVIMCSPSALFMEDIMDEFNAPAAQFLGKKRYDELSSISSKRIAQEMGSLNIQSVVTVGSLEYERNINLVLRAQQLAQDSPSKAYVEIEGAEHSIRESTYAAALSRIVSNIDEA